MIFRVETTPSAEREAQAILKWLLDQQAGERGLRWFLNLEQAIQSLSHFPEHVAWLGKTSDFRSRSGSFFMVAVRTSTESCSRSSRTRCTSSISATGGASGVRIRPENPARRPERVPRGP